MSTLSAEPRGGLRIDGKDNRIAYGLSVRHELQRIVLARRAVFGQEGIPLRDAFRTPPLRHLLLTPPVSAAGGSKDGRRIDARGH